MIDDQMSDTLHSAEHPRRIRSFVRRAGRLTPGQQRALDRLWPVLGVDRPAEPLNLAELLAFLAGVLVLAFGVDEFGFIQRRQRFKFLFVISNQFQFSM